jgi:hypothetical protein
VRSSAFPNADGVADEGKAIRRRLSRRVETKQLSASQEVSLAETLGCDIETLAASTPDTRVCQRPTVLFHANELETRLCDRLRLR